MRIINDGELLEACRKKTNTKKAELDDGLRNRLGLAVALVHRCYADLLPDEVQVYCYSDSEPDAFFLLATAGELVLCVSAKTASLGLTEQRLILCGAVEDLVEEGPLYEMDIPKFDLSCGEAEA